MAKSIYHVYFTIWIILIETTESYNSIRFQNSFKRKHFLIFHCRSLMIYQHSLVALDVLFHLRFHYVDSKCFIGNLLIVHLLSKTSSICQCSMSFVKLSLYLIKKKKKTQQHLISIFFFVLNNNVLWKMYQQWQMFEYMFHAKMKTFMVD